MREDVKVKVDLEAEDALAVRLSSLSMEVTPPPLAASVRDALQRQTRLILDGVTWFEQPLALIEADGVSNAVLIRSRTPVSGRFVQIILRGGNSIQLQARGGAAHLSRENYQKLLELFTSLLS